MFQYPTDTVVEGDRSDTAGWKPECMKVSASNTCATAYSATGRLPGVVVVTGIIRHW